MAKDFNDAFETSDGVSIGNFGIFAGSLDPWLEPVLNAPVGSRYFLTDNSGTQYYKIGTGDLEADWKKVTRRTLGAPPLTLNWTSFKANPLDYLDIGKVTSSNIAHSVPFDTTAIALTASYQKVDAGGATIRIYVDGVDTGVGLTLTASATPGVQNIDNLTLEVPLLSRIQLRMLAGSASVDVLCANLVLEGSS